MNVWMRNSRLARRGLCCSEVRCEPERLAWAKPCCAPEEGGDCSFSLSQDDSLPPGEITEMQWEKKERKLRREQRSLDLTNQGYKNDTWSLDAVHSGFLFLKVKQMRNYCSLFGIIQIIIQSKCVENLFTLASSHVHESLMFILW